MPVELGQSRHKKLDPPATPFSTVLVWGKIELNSKNHMPMKLNRAQLLVISCGSHSKKCHEQA
jgi:hypothetical protein